MSRKDMLEKRNSIRRAEKKKNFEKIRLDFPKKL